MLFFSFIKDDPVLHAEGNKKSSIEAAFTLTLKYFQSFHWGSFLTKRTIPLHTRLGCWSSDCSLFCTPQCRGDSLSVCRPTQSRLLFRTLSQQQWHESLPKGWSGEDKFNLVPAARTQSLPADFSGNRIHGETSDLLKDRASRPPCESSRMQLIGLNCLKQLISQHGRGNVTGPTKSITFIQHIICLNITGPNIVLHMMTKHRTFQLPPVFDLIECDGGYSVW